MRIVLRWMSRVLAPPRLLDHMKAKCARIIGSQIVEDCFNKAKGRVDAQKNTMSSAQATMATCIDTKVIESVHSFTPINVGTAPVKRGSTFEPSTFRPRLQQRHLDEATKSLKLWEVAGYGVASWFSPGSQGMFLPHADIEVLRQCKQQRKMGAVDKKLFCRLVDAGIAIQHKASGDRTWYLGMGTLEGSLAVAWPLLPVGARDDLFTITATSTKKLFVILDPGEWLAAPVRIDSPLRQAVQRELDKVNGEQTAARIVHWRCQHLWRYLRQR